MPFRLYMHIHKSEIRVFSPALIPHKDKKKRCQTKDKNKTTNEQPIKSPNKKPIKTHFAVTKCPLNGTETRVWCSSDPVIMNHCIISEHTSNFLTSFPITWQIYCFFSLSLCKEQITLIIIVEKFPSNSKTEGFKNVSSIWIAFSSPIRPYIELPFYRYSGCIIK